MKDLNPLHWGQHLIHDLESHNTAPTADEVAGQAADQAAGWAPTISSPGQVSFATLVAAGIPHLMTIPSHDGMAPTHLSAALGVAQENPMADTTTESKFEQKVEALGGDLKSLFAKVAADWRKAKQAWVLISSPQTRAFLIKAGADGLKAINDADAAVAAKGLNLQLDEQLVEDGKQLIADAKAGEGVIINDLKILGITL